MTPRQRALEIVKQLQAAGFSALWAGGCVRDAMLGKEPKDYDVATSATPDQVQEVFGLKRTLAIGKSFGVITVLGPKSAGPVEVATFRRDGDYSDGRRPDSVEFTDAREDALRRDFTINGMFFDPVTEEVIDYVEGQQDLEARQIRAIGNANERIDEDKLRMLRAVRFASTYGFSIEPETLKAIQENATEISAVSPERIGGELRRMLAHSGKAKAFELLVESGLWAVTEPMSAQPTGSLRLAQIKESLERLKRDDFAVVIAIVSDRNPKTALSLKETWKLKNEEVVKASWLVKAMPVIERAADLAWSELQPWLVSPHATDALHLVEAVSPGEFDESLTRCRECLAWDLEKLNPPALLDGNMLTKAGIAPGPQFKSLLSQVRALQLDGKLDNSEAALRWAISTAKQQ